ncbi:unnamed protein product [Amoebophrya sp. A25]|nr:unnamed protein product [Amoebophrya sp. A25]|eukprot:GSA25T00017656001.1
MAPAPAALSHNSEDHMQEADQVDLDDRGYERPFSLLRANIPQEQLPPAKSETNSAKELDGSLPAPAATCLKMEQQADQIWFQEQQHNKHFPLVQQQEDSTRTSKQESPLVSDESAVEQESGGFRCVTSRREQFISSSPYTLNTTGSPSAQGGVFSLTSTSNNNYASRPGNSINLAGTSNYHFGVSATSTSSSSSSSHRRDNFYSTPSPNIVLIDDDADFSTGGALGKQQSSTSNEARDHGNNNGTMILPEDNIRARRNYDNTNTTNTHTDTAYTTSSRSRARVFKNKMLVEDTEEDYHRTRSRLEHRKTPASSRASSARPRPGRGRYYEEEEHQHIRERHDHSRSRRGETRRTRRRGRYVDYEHEDNDLDHDMPMRIRRSSPTPSPSNRTMASTTRTKKILTKGLHFMEDDQLVSDLVDLDRDRDYTGAPRTSEKMDMERANHVEAAPTSSSSPTEPTKACLQRPAKKRVWLFSALFVALTVILAIAFNIEFSPPTATDPQSYEERQQSAPTNASGVSTSTTSFPAHASSNDNENAARQEPASRGATLNTAGATTGLQASSIATSKNRRSNAGHQKQNVQGVFHPRARNLGAASTTKDPDQSSSKKNGDPHQVDNDFYHRPQVVEDNDNPSARSVDGRRPRPSNGDHYDQGSAPSGLDATLDDEEEDLYISVKDRENAQKWNESRSRIAQSDRLNEDRLNRIVAAALPPRRT